MADLIPHTLYEVVPVRRLPLPTGMTAPPCMVSEQVWRRRRLRRRAPWLIRPQQPEGCCFYHAMDWRAAAGAAVRLVRRAQAAGLHGVDIEDYADEHLEAEGLGAAEEKAFGRLIGEGAGIVLHDPDVPWPYVDGRHRVAAQMDQGVAETVVQRFVLLDPATGRPVTD